MLPMRAHKILAAAALLVLCGCSAQTNVIASTPTMVSICMSQGGNWQDAVNQAQTYCSKMRKSATLIQRATCPATSIWEAPGVEADFHCE